MTTEQAEKFRFFGCVPRCVIQFAARKGILITQDDFCNRYESHFIMPAERYGWLSYEAVLPILQDLGVATAVMETDDYEAARNAFDIEKRLVLVRSLVNLNSG